MSGIWDNDLAVDRLKALLTQGHSAAQAANVLSKEFVAVSRAAVIGKASRMGLTLGNPKRAQEVRTIQVRRIAASSPAPIAPLPASLTNPSRLAEVDAIATAPKVITDPAFGGCRWPLHRTSEDGQTLHCCNSREAAPYCPGHARLAFAKTQPSDARRAEAAQIAANQKANAGAHRNALTFSPRAMA